MPVRANALKSPHLKSAWRAGLAGGGLAAMD